MARWHTNAVLTLALSGCTWLSDEDLSQRLDIDGDGVPAPEDCDPEDGDASDVVEYYADDDGDGAGDPENSLQHCGPPPEGYVGNALDGCPDHAALTEPAVWFEDVDQDGVGSDTSVTACANPDDERPWAPVTGDICADDPSRLLPGTWYADDDGDGAGDPATGTTTCTPEPSWVTNDGDGCPADRTLSAPVLWYLDEDEDGLGDDASETEACAPPDARSWVLVAGDDCPQTGRRSEPIEWFRDQDGDGVGSTEADDRELACEAPTTGGPWVQIEGDACPDTSDRLAPITWYEDADGDGLGSVDTFVVQCAPPDATWVQSTGDLCPDHDALINPVVWYRDQDEDGVGSDHPDDRLDSCGEPDDGPWVLVTGDACPDTQLLLSPQTWYRDQDQDGIGSNDVADELTTCLAPVDDGPWLLVDGDDCPETPGPQPTRYFEDAEGDGAGDPAVYRDECDPPGPGWVTNSIDQCPTTLITAPSTYFVDADLDGVGDSSDPGVPACDSPGPAYSLVTGDDCDGEPLLTRPVTYLRDDDEDGYGNLDDFVDACAIVPPVGLAFVTELDCDDDDPDVWAPIEYYLDDDEDGYGDDVLTPVCAATAPVGYATNDLDCDDDDPTIYPGAVEIYGEPFDAVVDNDCDPSNDRDEDGDGEDGYGGPDCDDTNPNVASYLAEDYDDPVDNDCDPATNDLDEDGDGYERPEDCDDEDPSIHPGAFEVPDLVDDNCDPLGHPGIWCGVDSDGDTFGSEVDLVAKDGSEPSDCVGVGEAGVAVGLAGDCDDQDGTIYPGALEACDGIDSDCDDDADGALITLSTDGGDPVAIGEGHHVLGFGDHEVRVCALDSGTADLSIDKTAGTLVLTGVERPQLVRTGTEPLLAAGIGTTVHLEDVDLLGSDDDDDLTLIFGAAVTTEGVDFDDVNADVGGSSDLVIDDATLTTTSFDVSGGLTLTNVTNVLSERALVSADFGFVLINGISHRGQAWPMIEATSSSVSVLSGSVSDNPGLVFELTDTTLTSIGGTYYNNVGGLVKGVGGASFFSAAYMLSNGGDLPMVEATDHDLSLTRISPFYGNTGPSGYAIVAIDSDVLLRQVEGSESTGVNTGIATVGYGDLVVDASYLDLPPDRQSYPLFEAWSSDVFFEDSTFAGSGGTPPRVLEGWGIFGTMRGTTVHNVGTNTSSYQPTHPALMLNWSYLDISDSTLASDNCPPATTCTAGDYGTVLIEATGGGVTLQQVDMQTSGIGIDLTSGSYAVHTGTSPLPGEGCDDDRESLNVGGATAVQLDDSSNLDLFVCNVGDVATRVGDCVQARGDPMLDADCDPGQACVCVDF